MKSSEDLPIFGGAPTYPTQLKSTFAVLGRREKHKFRDRLRRSQRECLSALEWGWEEKSTKLCSTEIWNWLWSLCRKRHFRRLPNDISFTCRECKYVQLGQLFSWQTLNGLFFLGYRRRSLKKLLFSFARVFGLSKCMRDNNHREICFDDKF